MKFSFLQNKFQIGLLRKESFMANYDQIEVATKTLKVDFTMKGKGFLLDLSLASFRIKYANIGAEKREIFSQQVLLCRKQQGGGEQFLALNLEDHPAELKGLNKKIKMQLGSINFIYNKRMIDCALDIFNFDNVNTDLTDHIKSEAK